ncbi:MAG TPA: hypothetical protein VFZ51_01670 [Woeseiaceae bacterium]
MSKPDDNDIDYERDELMLAARRLPRAIAPGRDLWPGVAKVIEEEKTAAPRGKFRWNTLLAQAAAVVLLVGGSSGITWLAMKPDTQTMTTEPPAVTLQFQPVAGSFGSQYHLGPEFVDARNDLAARLDEELARLSPETRAEVEGNLETIRAAIVEINLALAEQPDNALLQQLLINAYRDELSVMSRVDSMANSVMRRSDI